MKKYKTRRHQIEAIGREFKAGKISFPNLLRFVAMVAACEERDHCLISAQTELVNYPRVRHDLENRIVSKSILKVIGYEKGN